MFNNVELAPHHDEKEILKRRELLDRGVDSAVRTSFIDRWKQVTQTEKGKNAVDAWKRLSFNAAFTALDAAPVVGDLSEASLTTVKVSKEVLKSNKDYDPTPDISATEAVAIDLSTAPLEALTGGALPSYGIKTVRQLHADIEKGNFKGSSATLGYLFTGNPKYYEELQGDLPRLESYKKVLAA